MNATQADIFTDFHGLANLKSQAGRDQSAALEQTARQFEAIFFKMMLKSMRDAVPESGLLNDDKSKFYQNMYDDQLTLSLSKNPGIGLADMIVKQLGGEVSANSVSETGKTLSDYRMVPVPDAVQSASVIASDPVASSAIHAVPERAIESPEDFVRVLWPHAEEAARELGVDPKVLLAQSALETGWGQHLIRDSNGQNSHNLFGIKAHRDWDGSYVTVPTLEYHEQQAVRRHEPFRAYSSFAESFQDYVNFLKSNPRYEGALNAADSADDYIQGLQDAGYATDPKYADKIRSILNRDDFTVWTDQFKAGDASPITA